MNTVNRAETQSAGVSAILDRYEAWMQAIRERDLDAIMDIYSDQAAYMPPGRAACIGKAALRANWASYLQREEFVAHYIPEIHLSEGGDMAYDIGRYKISMKKNGATAVFEGKYVVVWQHIDGRWMAVADIDNDNGASS